MTQLFSMLIAAVIMSCGFSLLVGKGFTTPLHWLGRKCRHFCTGIYNKHRKFIWGMLTGGVFVLYFFYTRLPP